MSAAPGPRAPWRGRLSILPWVLTPAVLALVLAADAGVKGPRALPELALGLAAAVLLFGLPGAALARRLLPPAAAALWPFFALPLGAAAATLAMTVLGFARVPIELSIAVVMAGGAATLVAGRGRPRPGVTPGLGAPLFAVAAIAALAVAIALVPAFRSGFATVPGENPDAHLVTGSAVLLQQAPPDATRIELPVDEVPDVWRSKHPILYGLAGVSELSGLDPIEAFPAVSALLLGLVVAGFALVALLVLRAPPLAAPLAAFVLMLDAAALHIAVHPYWNQLWGLATLPFALVLGWLAVAERHRGAAALFALTLVLGVFAYPLMVPYPVIAVGGFALMSGLRPRLPDWPRRRLTAAGGIALVLLAVPIYGAAEKIVSAARQFTDPSPDLSAWTGDIVDFLPAESFVSLRGGAFAFVAVALVAALGLWRAVPREAAIPLAVLLALSGLAMLRFRTIEFGAYFDYKHLAFVAPILLVLAVAALAWVAGLGRAGLAGAAVAAVAWGAAATAETREELGGAFDQVTPSMLELREWSGRIPADATIRLDIPPTGVQLWAGYFMHEHALTAFIPVVGTTYPHAPQGIRADYSLAVNRLPDPDGPGEVLPPTADAIPEPVLRNEQFVLRRLRPAPPEIPATASKRMVPGVPASQRRPGDD